MQLNKTTLLGALLGLSVLVSGLAITAAAHANLRIRQAEEVHQAPEPGFNTSLLSPKQKGVISLYTGKASELTGNWTHLNGKTPTWKAMPGGSLRTMNGDIISKQLFKDAVYHVEFKVPLMPNAHGQGRGNSGVIIHGCYEIQVLDSYGIAVPGSGDCGAVYSTHAPLFNACRKPEQWQSYDIIFRAPRYDADGKKSENARVTVFLNGILVQNNVEIPGSTGLRKQPDGDFKTSGPLLLQFHGNAVEFRNVLALPLPDKVSEKY